MFSIVVVKTIISTFRIYFHFYCRNSALLVLGIEQWNLYTIPRILVYHESRCIEFLIPSQQTRQNVYKFIWVNKNFSDIISRFISFRVIIVPGWGKKFILIYNPKRTTENLDSCWKIIVICRYKYYGIRVLKLKK